MKTNHDKVEQAIRNAIAACGYDAVFGETRRHLSFALASAQKVSAKRKRKATTEKFNQEAKTKNDEWWAMLKKNAVENFNEQNIKLDEESNES